MEAGFIIFFQYYGHLDFLFLHHHILEALNWNLSISFVKLTIDGNIIIYLE